MGNMSDKVLHFYAINAILLHCTTTNNKFSLANVGTRNAGVLMHPTF